MNYTHTLFVPTYVYTHAHTQLSPLLDPTLLLSSLHPLTSHPSLGTDLKEEREKVQEAISGDVTIATNKRRKRPKHKKRRTNPEQ